MKKIINITELDLIKIIKKVINEEKYSEEDISYIHPITEESCKIKIAKNKSTNIEWNKYGAILVCEDKEYGGERIEAELPIFDITAEGVNDFICENIERTFEILDDMLSYEEEVQISEEIYSQKWSIIDQPIFCSDRPKKKKSWEN